MSHVSVDKTRQSLFCITPGVIRDFLLKYFGFVGIHNISTKRSLPVVCFSVQVCSRYVIIPLPAPMGISLYFSSTQICAYEILLNISWWAAINN